MKERKRNSMVSIRQIRSGISIDIQGEVTKYSEDTLLHAVDWSEKLPDFIIFNFKDVSYGSVKNFV